MPLLETIKLIPIVPGNFQILVSTVLPVVEIGLAFLMLLKMKPKLTLAFITMLFAFFLAFSIYGTVGGLDGDCGCFGNVVKSEFGITMIIRNFVFLIFSLLLWASSLNNKYNSVIKNRDIIEK